MLLIFREVSAASVFIANDLKSYYASVECVHRGLDPPTTNLLVADESRTDKTELDEKQYRRQLWGHWPITAFWHVGPGKARRLAKYGMTTMGDVARMSLTDEEFLYKLFGIDAEILIDHAWGPVPVTMKAIKEYNQGTLALRGAGSAEAIQIR